MSKKGKKIQHHKTIKEQVLLKLQSLKPAKNATASQAVECLVKQAEYYANYLLSKHSIKSIKPSSSQTWNKTKTRKRGQFQAYNQSQQSPQNNQLIQQQQQNFTRLLTQPSILQGGQLKYYQLISLNWMISLYQSGINGILADDMGLGKTIQTISMLGFIQEYKKVKGPFLIIGPKVTLGNWCNEIKKWMPHKKVVKLVATKEQREELLEKYIKNEDFDIAVTSFEGVRICLSYLRKIKWHYIVIDQAHKIKNDQSQLSKVIRKLQTQRKLLLTGTPLQNNLKQLWSLLNFLLPQLFDSSDLFDNWFNNYQVEEGVTLTQQQTQKKNIQLIGQLHKILKPFMLRRTKLQVQTSLPPKKQIHIYVGLTDMQLKVYKNLLQTRSTTQNQKRTYLNLLMQLRKACNHPYLFPDIEDKSLPFLGQHLIQNSGKMLVLDRLLSKLYHDPLSKHRILIFSQMTMLLDILQDYCNWRGYSYCRIDGSTEMNIRQQQIQSFMDQKSDKFIFLLSTRAGGLGINLTSADTVVIYDSDWNPQMDLQAMDRAHRIGQKNKVNVYRLITENTVQEKIIQRQTVKLKWDSLVIQQSKTAAQKGNKNLTKQQMKQMLQFGASTIIKASKGTISDEQIDQILKRGQTKTNQLNQQIQNKLKSKQNNLVDFSMNSINIFEFMQNDEKKRRQDAEALLIMAQKDSLGEMRSRRDKGKLNYFQNLEQDQQKKQIKIQKKAYLPEYHFYQQKDKLLSLLQKQLNCSDDDSLSPQQQQLKQKLLLTGFNDWSKNDYLYFISGCQKYGRHSYQKISRKVGKQQIQIQMYSRVFWERIDQLPDKEKIIKMIQSGEDRLENYKQQEQLLKWKAKRCYQMEFNQNFYAKCKSKFFTYQNDKYLADKIMRMGLRKIPQIREQIKSDSRFRFDYYFKTRSEGELNKRLVSIFKVLEKQRDSEQMGINGSKLSKKETKMKKIMEKNIEEEKQ